MASYLPAFTAAIEALITTACPEVAGQVWLAEVAMRETLDAIAARGDVPYVVVHYAGFRTAEWGMSNFAYEATVEIVYIRKVPEDIAGLMGRLEALRDVFEDECKTQTMTTGQILDVEEVSFSALSPWNMRFISKELPYVAGSVTIRAVAGEQA